MSLFHYQNGELFAEDVPVSAIAADVGTPVYIYSTAALVASYREYADAFEGMPATICYAVKANDSLAVLRTLAKLGSGADIVSGGELRAAMPLAFQPARSCSPASVRPVRSWPTRSPRA